MSSFDDPTQAESTIAYEPPPAAAAGTTDRRGEIAQLTALSSKVLLVLAAAGAVGIVAAVVVLLLPGLETSSQALLGAVLAGFVGACVAASISVAQRRSNGWEFEDGAQWPESHAQRERFNAAMVPFFLLRPFLGAALGLFTYGAAVGGIVFATGRPVDLEELQPTAMVAFGFLAGLFSKTLIEKLRAGFDAFLSSS